MNKDTASDPGDPNDTVKRYTLYEVQTTGLEPAVIDNAKCENLTKEVCNHYMQIPVSYTHLTLPTKRIV